MLVFALLLDGDAAVQHRGRDIVVMKEAKHQVRGAESEHPRAEWGRR